VVLQVKYEVFLAQHNRSTLLRDCFSDLLLQRGVSSLLSEYIQKTTVPRFNYKCSCQL